MKIKLLTICLLLVTSQVFADPPFLNDDYWHLIDNHVCKGKDTSKWNNCYNYTVYNYGALKEIVFYKNGMKNGESNEYNDEGFLINKSFYVDDKKEGWETEYYYKYEDYKYEGLKIAYEVFYKNGKKEGKQYSYHESGKVKYKGKYKKGVPEGNHTLFGEKGEVLNQVFMCEGNDTSTWNDCIGRIRLEGEIADCSFDLSEKNFRKNIYKNIYKYWGACHSLFIGEWKNGKQIGVGRYEYVVKHNYKCMNKEGYIKPNFNWTLAERRENCMRTYETMYVTDDFFYGTLAEVQKNIKLKIFKNISLFDEN